MVMKKLMLATAVASAALLASASAADAQLAREGAYSGIFAWTLLSTPHQLAGEHVFSHDIYRGIFLNDAGEGFLHESSLVCPAISDLVAGEGTAHGHCVVTDKDDDQAFLTWKGVIDAATGFNGDFQWTGGTGKYAGLGGNSTFSAILIGSSSEGRGLFQGEWRLP